MNKNKKKGFTIVELVIVIAVIAILSAVLIPTFSNVTKEAREAARDQEVRSAVVAIVSDQDVFDDEVYYLNYKSEKMNDWYKVENGEATLIPTGEPKDLKIGEKDAELKAITGEIENVSTSITIYEVVEKEVTNP